WRGADIENILRFERDYPACKVVLLETNYRSTKTICRAANELIKHNKLRKEKVLVTDNPEGSPVVVHDAPDDRAEATFVGEKMGRGIGKSTVGKLKEYAKKQGIPLAQAIGHAEAIDGIPARARGALSEVAGLIERLSDRARESSVESLIRDVVTETNYLAYLTE